MQMKRFEVGLLVALVLTLGAAACGDLTDTGGSSAANMAARRETGGGDAGCTAQKDIVDTALANGNFTTLTSALVSTGLDDALRGEGPFTVFAPTDAAFAALPEGTLESLTQDQLAFILKYHALSGYLTSNLLKAGPVPMLNGISAFIKTDQAVMINDANVTTADIRTSNGVIHVIDKVLLPPNLVQAAKLAGDFDTLLAAAEQAGLAEALTSPSADLTVFAPTNQAFDALPAGTLSSLSNEQLSNVLSYHVVSGRVLSTDLENGQITMLNGDNALISVEGPCIKINDAVVIIPDVIATNGVIHAIDKVLLPPKR